MYCTFRARHLQVPLYGLVTILVCHSISTSELEAFDFISDSLIAQRLAEEASGIQCILSTRSTQSGSIQAQSLLLSWMHSIGL